MKKNKEKKIDLLYTISKDGKKNYTLCTENIKIILSDHPLFEDCIKKDVFRNIIEIKLPNTSEFIQFIDVHAIIIAGEIAKNFSFFQRVTKGMVIDAVEQVAEEKKYDSAMEYINSLKWDGKNRVDKWLSLVYGVDNDEYHKAVGSNWLKGLVKRIIDPGCKFDYVLVIEGEQGTGKSRSLSALGKEWYLETFMNTESKDFFMQFQGKAIIEFSEGETLSRTDVKRMKAIITTQVDRFRAPYERIPKDHPRRCVFAMTTNETEYLKDDTGNRRWLPIKMKSEKADVQWIEDNRDQLFAEAYHRVHNLKETIHEFPKEETMEHQASRMETSPYQERIEDWYFNKITQKKRDEGITVQEIWETVIHQIASYAKPMTRYDEMVLGGVLKKIGLEKRRIMVDNIRRNRWYLKEEYKPKTTLKVSNYIESI